MKSRAQLSYDSSQHGSFSIDELREVLRYRHLIWQLIRRDILTRYKRSVLGVGWTMLNPLGMMIVLTIAFSQIFKVGDIRGYPTFVLSGLLVWNFFSQTTTAAMINLVWGGGLLQRIYIPRTSFAVASVGTGIVNTTLGLIPLLLVMLVLKNPIGPSFLLFPLPIVLIAMFALGVGLLLSTIAVYFPDVSEMYQILLSAWMYLTPIIYPETILPQGTLRLIAIFNPMYHLIKLFRIVIYDARFPTWNEILVPSMIAIGTLLLGWIIFSNRSRDFAYRI